MFLRRRHDLAQVDDDLIRLCFFAFDFCYQRVDSPVGDPFRPFAHGIVPDDELLLLHVPPRGSKRFDGSPDDDPDDDAEGSVDEQEDPPRDGYRDEDALFAPDVN